MKIIIAGLCATACAVLILGSCATKPADSDSARLDQLQGQVNLAQKTAMDRNATIVDLQKQVADLNESSQKAAKDLDARVVELTKTFAPYVANGDIKIKRYRNVLVIEVTESILFAPDSAELLVKNTDILKTLADIFKRTPDRVVRVEGNTAIADSVPAVLKIYPTSWHLGATRAANVVQFLQVTGGLDPKQLVATSLGEFNPIGTNATTDGKTQNRRVEFVLSPRELWRMDQMPTIKAK